MFEIPKYLAVGVTATKNYDLAYFIYMQSKIFSEGFDLNTEEEFNNLFKKYVAIRDKEGKVLPFEKFILDDTGKPADVIITFFKLRPRRTKKFLIEATNLLKYDWEKIVKEYLEADPEDLKDIKTKDEMKKYVLNLTKNVNKRDKAFTLKSYELIFGNKDILPKELKKLNVKDILDELIEEGEIYLSEDGTYRISEVK